MRTFVVIVKSARRALVRAGQSEIRWLKTKLTLREHF
jgi:hypothetical protein